ncbi:putative RNA-directed DNA polymerase from mobile element jockey-like 63 [Homarus americanus]|uniref:Putative RNA-directed DNA polymerase from mobile element jockey-like 63 n=1 Tax=Homarus americanus TaxID=6706 RepID=A0A8J5JRS7_HOMAM|nr:putative RNA-directed DNA polymerase from mobile element jockey-like 63 [Homarus americanus]
MPQEASKGKQHRHKQYVPSNPPRGRTTHLRDSDCDEVQDSQRNRIQPCIRGSGSTGTRIQEHQIQREAQSSWRPDTFPQDHNTAKILSEVTNFNGKTMNIIPLDPEEKTTRMVRLRYPLELPVEVIIKHPKVTKAECCVTSQDKAQTKQVLVDIKGTVPEEVDLGNWGTYKLRPFVPEPLQCYTCQEFGYHQFRCHKKVRCGICSQNHKTEMCIQKPRQPSAQIVERNITFGVHHAQRGESR